MRRGLALEFRAKDNEQGWGNVRYSQSEILERGR